MVLPRSNNSNAVPRRSLLSCMNVSRKKRPCLYLSSLLLLSEVCTVSIPGLREADQSPRRLVAKHDGRKYCKLPRAQYNLPYTSYCRTVAAPSTVTSVNLHASPRPSLNTTLRPRRASETLNTPYQIRCGVSSCCCLIGGQSPPPPSPTVPLTLFCCSSVVVVLAPSWAG